MSQKLFEWDQFRTYEENMSGVEEKLIENHFNQMSEGNDWGQDGWSSPEAQFYFSLFRYGWMLGRMFTDG